LADVNERPSVKTDRATVVAQFNDVTIRVGRRPQFKIRNVDE